MRFSLEPKMKRLSFNLVFALSCVIQAAQRIFADDKRAAGMGPNTHEADDFRPTRELSDDFRIPGG